MNKTNSKIKAEVCYHCGDACDVELIIFDEKQFCCHGCKTVYEILAQNDLCDYYRIEQMPGITPKIKTENKFEYLENESIIEQLVDFKNESISKVHFFIPQIHCSSCLWLLENLYKLHEGVSSSRVNFMKKEISISFKNEYLSLRKLVELLASLGYEPEITLDQLSPNKRKKVSRRLIYQIGLAGFAFGNIMLMSLPEYFGLDEHSFDQFSKWFGWLNLIIATPVAIYSGQDYFKSSWISLKQRRLNIDIPIAIGLFVLYFRSSYEIISKTGPGYFDSLCGLLFFLLIGRIFQEKTYHQLSFERDYKSYFPISVSRISKKGIEVSTPVNDIKKGDRLRIRNGELIPVDAILISGEANIDNSFATGESDPIKMVSGDRIYAGGKQEGESIIVEAIRPLSQSKLTRLWNEQSGHQHYSSSFSEMTDQISQWFTPIILIIALLSGLWQMQHGLGKAIQVVSAVLIVACPCALALAAPFTFGHGSRWLGRQKCYLRDSFVIETMAKLSHLVFDKTGTLTYSRHKNIEYIGKVLSPGEQAAIRSIFYQSNHPLSRLILAFIPKVELLEIEQFEEIAGQGMQARIKQISFRIGSAKWIKPDLINAKETIVVIEKDGEYLGHYLIKNEYRKGLETLAQKLNESYELSILSGDNDGQQEKLKTIFGHKIKMLFNQSPQDKLNYIKQIQKSQQVMMIGDGLNDAGALNQSDVGLAIAEDTNAFSPACDIILGAEHFENLATYLAFTKSCKRIVIISFVISFLYNLVGLTLAVQGLLSPVYAAILMPLSSVSVVGFVSLAVNWKAYHIEKQIF
ncbi:MAG: heavy metal translocating P-type ATPase metal-binding domain-containing protein [Flavobacteriales bacterium]|nr:heavy metal translocating P-type ATPase metal-binding domain-containing protein [Flavobacteriales bacterium]